MATCVLDTDVVIAALDRADAHHAAAAHQHEIDAISLRVRGRVVGQPVEAGDRDQARIHL